MIIKKGDNEMKFETLKQAIEHFKNNGINHDKGINYVLAFQDAIGQRSMQDILDSFQDMNKNERGTFLWVSCHCLDKDMFLDILKKAVCQAAINEEVAILDGMYLDRVETLKKRESYMTDIEQQNAVNVERIKYLEMQLSIQTAEADRFREKAHSFDTIKNLLK